MLKLMKYFRTAISSAIFLFGIFLLPKDVMEVPQAAKPWQMVLSMVDQNTALWAFAFCLLLWLFLSAVLRMTSSREFKDKWSRWRNGVTIDWNYSTIFAPSFGVDAHVSFLKGGKRALVSATTYELVAYIDGTLKWVKLEDFELFRSEFVPAGERKNFDVIRRETHAFDNAQFFGKPAPLNPSTTNVFRLEIVVGVNGRTVKSKKEVEMHTYSHPTSRLRSDCEPELEKS